MLRFRSIIESLVFVSDEPMTVQRIHEIVEAVDGQVDKEEIGAVLEELVGEGRAEGTGSGFRLVEVAGGYQYRTVIENGPYLRQMVQSRPKRLSRAALETLAIVAYRQPVTRPEIEEIRGVDCGGVMKALLDRGFMKIVGKREESGRPLLYGTTRSFLEFFNLNSLSSLPTLKEYQELTEESRAIVDEELSPPLFEGAPLSVESESGLAALHTLDRAFSNAVRANRGMESALELDKE